MEEKLTISILSAELEKLGSRIQNDLENFLVEYDGSLKDTVPGTRIKIPLGVGSVSFWTSATGYSITVYLSQEITEDLQLNLNHDDEK